MRFVKTGKHEKVNLLYINHSSRNLPKQGEKQGQKEKEGRVDVRRKAERAGK